MLCCVYTRFVYEVPYIDSFIEHYLRLGFDKIFILYHDIISYDVPEHLLEEVELIKVENNGNKLLNEYKHLFQDENDTETHYDWVLNVDADEFLLLDAKYRSIKEYIHAKLCEESEINIFQFSWGWLHAFNPPSDYTLSDFLNNYKVFVGSKDNNTPDIWVKSMSKVDDIEYMTCHNCVLKRNNEAVIYVNGDVLRKINDETIDEDEDDDDINLLPRSYSYDEVSTYSEAILIHINTRNMMNAIIKGLNIHVTQVKRKRIKKFKQLKKFVNAFDFSKPLYKETLDEFTSCIGYKIKFPLLCLEKEEIHEKIRHLKLGTTTGLSPLCRDVYIPEQNRYHLDNLQDRMNSIFHMLDLEKFVRILSLFATLFDNTFKRRAVAG